MSATPAIHSLREQKVAFSEHEYRYEERGGTAVSSRELGVDEHSVIKTLVMEDENKKPLIVLMHGDREVSTKNLARQIGARTVSPCAPDVAQRHTGYMVGGTSPFGTRKPLPVYMEKTIADLDRDLHQRRTPRLPRVDVTNGLDSRPVADVSSRPGLPRRLSHRGHDHRITDPQCELI